jgi:hypothetical protein
MGSLTFSREGTSLAKFDELLAKHLTMNRMTWTVLQRHGVTQQSKLRLDFSYNAPNRAAADGLAALLRDETDYDVRVESQGSLLRRRWLVEGRTQTTSISPAILDEWVTWMVTAGKEWSCEFDGWGTGGAPPA